MSGRWTGQAGLWAGTELVMGGEIFPVLLPLLKARNQHPPPATFQILGFHETGKIQTVTPEATYRFVKLYFL